MTSVTENGHVRPITLEAGDEVVQFNRPNITIPTTMDAYFGTLNTIVGDVTGSREGVMTIESSGLAVFDLGGKGYQVSKVGFDGGGGNTFRGIMASDTDVVDNTSYNTGYFVSTSGTGEFADKKLIGSCSRTYIHDPATGSVLSASATMTFRCYSGTGISGPVASHAEGTGSEVFRSDLGPVVIERTEFDEFIRFSTISNFSIPQGDPAFYNGGTADGAFSYPLTGDMTSNTWNSVASTTTVPPYQGWSAGTFEYTDAGGTMKVIVLGDSFGGDPPETGTGHVYMFAMTETGIAGSYAGSEYFWEVSQTPGPIPSFYFDGSMYTLMPTAPDTTPPAPVNDLAVTDVSTDAVTLSWTAPGDDGNSGTASQYDIRLSASPVTEANWDSATPLVPAPVPNPAGSTEAVQVTGLSET